MTGEPPAHVHALAAAGGGRWTHDEQLLARESTVLFCDFCDFLELRAATKNIALLRRTACDYFAQHAQALHEFVELSVSLVAVLPFEVTNPSKRAMAAQILLQQQQQQQQQQAMQRRTSLDSPRFVGATAPHGGATSSVLAYLEARVGTKHMPRFQRIYSEFCVGREDALVDFFHRGAEAISVVPISLPPPGPSPWLVCSPLHLQSPPQLPSPGLFAAAHYGSSKQVGVTPTASAVPTLALHPQPTRTLPPPSHSTQPKREQRMQQRQQPNRRKRVRVGLKHTGGKAVAHKSPLRHATPTSLTPHSRVVHDSAKSLPT